jgi:hypothetical protein
MSASQELMNNFLDTVNEVGELESERVLLPDGLEANATIDKFELASGTSKSRDGEEERQWISVTFHFDLDSAEAREHIGRDKAIGIGRPMYLNFLEDRTLDPKNNVDLGKMLKICDINPTGLSTRDILNSLVNQYVRVRVVHRNYTPSGSTEQKTAANVIVIGPSE